MSIEDNKTLVRRFIEAIQENDTDTIDEISVAEIANPMKERTIPFVTNTFGENHIEIIDMVAEGDKVWARLSTSGGHTGEFMGIPPSGKQWTNTGMYFLTINDGKIASLESEFDLYNHLTQLGATIVRPSE